MKAACYTTNGDPSVLQYGNLPDPTVGDDEVLVRVEAISLEGGDIQSRRNKPPEHTPHVVGYAAAGVIEKVGPEVNGLVVGQRVACFNWQDSHAELFAVPADFVFPVPDGLDIQTAAVGLIAYGIAHDALFEFGGLKAGETVLIQGATGGVGLAAVQLASQAGATVLTTASSAERNDRLRDYGSMHGIDYKQDDIAARARGLTDDSGVDLVIDLAGGKSVQSVLHSLRYRGRMVSVGGASGEGASFEFGDIAPESLAVYGMLFGKELASHRVHKLVATLFADLAAGRITMPIDKKFPLSQAAEAHRYSEEGHPFGRIVMKP